MAGKFEVFTGKTGKHYFRLKASNGETILASQGYAAKASCMKGVESVRTNAARGAAAFEEKKAKNGQHYFVMKASNGRIIGTSEQYKTAASCAKCVKSVQKNAPGAKLVEPS